MSTGSGFLHHRAGRACGQIQARVWGHHWGEPCVYQICITQRARAHQDPVLPHPQALQEGNQWGECLQVEVRNSWLVVMYEIQLVLHQFWKSNWNYSDCSRCRNSYLLFCNLFVWLWGLCKHRLLVRRDQHTGIIAQFVEIIAHLELNVISLQKFFCDLVWHLQDMVVSLLFWTYST